MKPSERIPVILRATESLAARGPHYISVVLGEYSRYGPDPDEEWDDEGLLEHCRREIGALSNDSLLDLDQYLAMDSEIPEVQALPNVWTKHPVRVFISHIHAHAKFAGDVKRLLESRYGMAGFVAHDDIALSQTWRNTIRNALATCDVFVALLHDGFHASQWCDQEAGWAMARNIPIVPVMPVGFDHANAKDGFLEEHQALMLDKKPKRDHRFVAYSTFVTALEDKRTHRKAVKSLCEAFRRTDDSDAAGRLWELIEAESAIDSEDLRVLEQAVRENEAVREGYTVGDGQPLSDAVKDLVTRFEPPTPKTLDEPPF